jgi:tRNA pseudouridine38-40 synthase
MKYAGFVEYDGTNFTGWAAQPGLRTVEKTLTGALNTIFRQRVRLAVAGRTDAGVHASAQVVSFRAQTDLSPTLISYKASAILPEDLALRRCTTVSESFDARKDARSRSYEYRIVNDPIRSPLERLQAIHVPRELDRRLLEKSAALIQGRHNFRAFTPTNGHHVRFVRAVESSSWEGRDGLLVYKITANSFLYRMVRTLVGTMLEVASGRRELDSLEYLLSDGERKDAGPTAPARGLTLVGVDYKICDFKETL